MPMDLESLERGLWPGLVSTRMYFWAATAADKQAFYKKVAIHSGQAKHCKGPAGCLKPYLQQLDWPLSRDGCLQLLQFFPCHSYSGFINYLRVSHCKPGKLTSSTGIVIEAPGKIFLIDHSSTVVSTADTSAT